MLRRLIGCMCISMVLICGVSAGGLYAIGEKVYYILSAVAIVGIINFAIIAFICFFLIEEK